jgi:hypothetical protein
MNAEQLVKYCILELNNIWEEKEISQNLRAEEVEELWDEAECLSDAISEIREGEFETGVPCEYSRHYESKSVAAKAPNGQWVGWTYWYGGGKHGEPEAIDWIQHAYLLDCKEEQKMVTVREFTKIEEK